MFLDILGSKSGSGGGIHYQTINLLIPCGIHGLCFIIGFTLRSHLCRILSIYFLYMGAVHRA